MITNKFSKYLTIGAANTLVTTFVIYILYSMSFSDQLANFLGIIVGIIQSIFMNSKFTFDQDRLHLSKSFAYLLILLLAYLVNLFALNLCLSFFMLSSLMSQCIALILYVLTSFFLLNQYLFNNHNSGLK